MQKSNRHVPPSGDFTDHNFVSNINSVNKELGFHTTRQPCKEYLMARKLERDGYNLSVINGLSYEEMVELLNKNNNK